MSDLREQLDNGVFYPYGDEMNLNTELEGLSMEDEAAAFEILPGMTVTEMKTLFFDTETLIEPDYRLYQLNSAGHRYYYSLDENGEPTFYPSVTTVISQTTPTSPHLIKWIAEKGIEAADLYKMERAEYGTFMHACFEKLIINRTYDLDNLNNELLDYMHINRLHGDFIYHADELKKDILSFAQFVIDHDVRPYAVEIALKSDIMGTAGMLDLPCNMLEQIGGSKRINAIIDFKSGRKGFYPDHIIQLNIYKQMWNENFPQYPIDRIFNLAPKDWRRRPDYKLKDQTADDSKNDIPHLLALARNKDVRKNKDFTVVSGVVDLSKSGLDDNVIKMNLAEVIKKRAPKPEEMKPVEISDFEKAIKETIENGEMSIQGDESLIKHFKDEKALKSKPKQKEHINLPEIKESAENEPETSKKDISNLLKDDF